MKSLLIIPGLGDDVNWTSFLTRNWKNKYGIETHVVAFGWKGEAKEYKSKFNKTLKHLDKLLQKGNEISVLGISAGASAAVNLFHERRKIKHVISVCGRLNDLDIRPSWKNNVDSYRILKESIRQCEEYAKELTEAEKRKILTIRPIYDDIVPVRTMTMPGAVNKRIISAQHMISIALALTLYSDQIADFLTS